jgi:hypothetical protein
LDISPELQRLVVTQADVVDFLRHHQLLLRS